jgi:hypothetical protein
MVVAQKPGVDGHAARWCSITNSQNANRDKPNWCETGIFWIEIVGVIGLAFYCVVNWLEWRTFDSERQTMESEFQASQTK